MEMQKEAAKSTRVLPVYEEDPLLEKRQISLPQPTGPRSTSVVFWELVWTVTGFTGAMDALRDRPDLAEQDVCELVTDDIHWAQEGYVHALREDLQTYLQALRLLQKANAKRNEHRVRIKNYVEETRYQNMRDRESETRITSKHVAARVKQLFLQDRRISEVSDMSFFVELEELVLSHNKLEEITNLPKSLLLLAAVGNSLSFIPRHVLMMPTHLVLLELSCNKIEDISFVEGCSSLAILDVSYNVICDLEKAIDTIAVMTSLTEVFLCGNPLALQKRYRQAVISRCKQLKVLDTPITEQEGELHVASGQEEQKGNEIQLWFKFDTLKGLQSCMYHGKNEEEAAQKGKLPVKADKKAAKGKDDNQPQAVSIPVPKKTSVCISGQWCGTAIAPPECDALVQPSNEPDPKAPKGKKPHADAHAASVDELQVKYHAEFNVDPSEKQLTSWLMRPTILQVKLVDVLSDDSVEEFEIGGFMLDTSLLLAQQKGAVSSSLVISRKPILELEESIRKLKEHIAKLVQVDRDVDKQNLDSPPPTAEALPAGKKGEKGGKQTGKQAPNEQEIQRVNESTARKNEIEEWNAKLHYAEATVQRLSNMTLAMTATVARNTPLELEVAPVEVEKKDTKKKK